MNNQITITISSNESKEHPFFTTAFNTTFDWENQILYKKDKKNPFSGNILIYYSNGNKAMDMNWIDGEKHGKYQFYYTNGNIKYEGYYVNNELTGISRNYDENGNVYESSELLTRTDEQESWKITRYYSNGQKKEEGEKIKYGNSWVAPDYYIGHWIYYYENGQKKEEGNWKIGGMHGDDNVRSGVWKHYNKEGDEIQSTLFDNEGNQVN